MMVITAPAGYRVISAKEAEKRFAVSRDVGYPYREFADEQEIRLYEGGLHVAGTFTGEPGVDWQPYNTIVDGDLTVDDVFDWCDWGSGNFVLVTGDLRARHVSLDGCPTVVVRGDLLVSGGVQARRGDDGGFLKVRGRTAAGIIISTLYFNLRFDHQPEALLVADPYRTNCPVDLADDDLADAARPELLDDDGRPDEDRIEQALRDGRPILRADVQPSHLAALAELDALLPRAAEVSELDLADRKLREFPEQVFAFGNLRKLSLSGNDLIRRIPKRIAALGALEELDLSGLRLRRLPRAIGRLANLDTLNISGNRFRALPDELGDLTRLRVLHAEDLRCPVPASLGRLTELAEVNLAGLRPPKSARKAGKGVGAPFPVAVTTLPRLRTLDLSRSVLDEVPAALLRVTTIEELRLDGALGRVERLPELAKLPRLRVLRMDGGSGSTGGYPPHHLLDAVWSIGSLTELGIDRWGAQAGARPPLTRLPDEAFAGMPGLRVLDLSCNELTELPESFYRLPRLESVDLRHTRLDSVTLDRLGAVFPRVRMDLRHVPTRQDVADPVWRAVHERVRAGAAELTGDRERAVATFEEALRLCTPGARYSDHDRLYALYGLVDALSRLVHGAAEEARTAIVDKLIGYAEQALALLPDSIWHFTDEGAFQEEVQRRVGNSLAWHLMERGETGRALSIVEQALTFADGVEYDFVRDTQVRILLAAGRRDEAYRVVDRVLTRAPDFADFADLRADPDFQRWRGGHR